VGALAATAPDRRPGPGVATLSSASLAVAPGVSAYVTDRTYADVDVVMTAVPGAPAASVALRDGYGHSVTIPDGCGWKSPPAATSIARLEVKRVGQDVTVAVNALPPAACDALFTAGNRVSVGVTGAGGFPESQAASLTVTRLGSP